MRVELADGLMIITAQQYAAGYYVPGLLPGNPLANIPTYHMQFVLVKRLPDGNCVVRDPGWIPPKT